MMAVEGLGHKKILKNDEVINTSLNHFQAKAKGFIVIRAPNKTITDLSGEKQFHGAQEDIREQRKNTQ